MRVCLRVKSSLDATFVCELLGHAATVEILRPAFDDKHDIHKHNKCVVVPLSRFLA